MGHIETYINVAVVFGGIIVALMALYAVTNGYRKVGVKSSALIIVCFGVLIERGTTDVDAMPFTELFAIAFYATIVLGLLIMFVDWLQARWHHSDPEFE